jgi:hypothetical protein
MSTALSAAYWCRTIGKREIAAQARPARTGLNGNIAGTGKDNTMNTTTKTRKSITELASKVFGAQDVVVVKDAAELLASIAKGEPKIEKKPVAPSVKTRPLPKPTLNAESQKALDRTLAGIPAEVEAANARIAEANSALAKAHKQMAEDGAPALALRKPGEKPAPLGNGAKLPRSAPGRELAVPAAKPQPLKTPQTRKEQEAMAKKMGLALDTKPVPKPGQRERARYDWNGHEAAAKKGAMPPKLDFSADTHTRFRPTLAEIEAAAKAGDVKALRAIKINPVSSSPKAMIRWRDMCVAALGAKTKR